MGKNVRLQCIFILMVLCVEAFTPLFTRLVRPSRIHRQFIHIMGKLEVFCSKNDLSKKKSQKILSLQSHF